MKIEMILLPIYTPENQKECLKLDCFKCQYGREDNCPEWAGYSNLGEV